MAKRPPPKGLITNIINNIKQSFNRGSNDRFDRSKGRFVGVDFQGNTFYELPPDPRLGKRRPYRWFNPPSGFSKYNISKEFDSKLSSEWESWLRFRRIDPPTEEELVQNMNISEMKKFNAAQLETKRIEDLKKEGRYEGPPKAQDHEKPFFPKYDEYEIIPDDVVKDKKRWKEFQNPYYEDRKK